MSSPWLVKFRAQLKAGDMVEFRLDGKWVRRKITDLTGNDAQFGSYSMSRDVLYPAHGTDEWTQE